MVVSQGLNQDVPLVTGCLAISVLRSKPLSKVAKNFKWNRQVAKISFPFSNTTYQELTFEHLIFCEDINGESTLTL